MKVIADRLLQTGKFFHFVLKDATGIARRTSLGRALQILGVVGTVVFTVYIFVFYANLQFTTSREHQMQNHGQSV